MRAYGIGMPMPERNASSFGGYSHLQIIFLNFDVLKVGIFNSWKNALFLVLPKWKKSQKINKQKFNNRSTFWNGADIDSFLCVSSETKHSQSSYLESFVKAPAFTLHKHGVKSYTQLQRGSLVMHGGIISTLMMMTSSFLCVKSKIVSTGLCTTH